MPVKKIAISLPESVLEAVDVLAAERGETRSRLIARILARAAGWKRDRDVTKAVDLLFEGGELAAEQSKTSEAFRSAGPWRHAEW